MAPGLKKNCLSSGVLLGDIYIYMRVMQVQCLCHEKIFHHICLQQHHPDDTTLFVK